MQFILKLYELPESPIRDRLYTLLHDAWEDENPVLFPSWEQCINFFKDDPYIEDVKVTCTPDGNIRIYVGNQRKHIL